MFKWFGASGNWNSLYVWKVFHASARRPSYYACTLQFTASIRQVCTEKAPRLRRPVDRVSQPSVEDRVSLRRHLYTARGPFKDLISRRGWIKIRTSFLESKCIIVRFRTTVARSPEGEPAAFERATDALSFNRDLSTWKLPSRRPVLSGLWLFWASLTRERRHNDG